MKHFHIIAALALPLALAQHVIVPTTCTGNYSAGTDEVLYTVPYTYDQVISIIGNYSNLTWSGSPENSVTINGTNDQVGTARTYDLAGAHVIETILEYSKPPAPGPYNEVHNTALLSVPSAHVSFYIPYDGTVVSSICDGKASMFNFTAHYCATNATVAGGLLHMLHLGDAVTVGKFLGGMNYTSCQALGSSAMGPASQTAPLPSSAGTAGGNGTMGSGEGSPVPYTGIGTKHVAGCFGGVVAAIAGVLFL